MIRGDIDFAMRGRLGLQFAPVRDHLGPLAMHIQPRQRFVQRGAMEDRSLRADGSLGVEQPRLEREYLMEPLGVAARDRQQTELDTPLECVGREAAALDQPERMQQGAREHGVRQRFRRRLESGAATAIRRRRPAPA